MKTAVRALVVIGLLATAQMGLNFGSLRSWQRSCRTCVFGGGIHTCGNPFADAWNRLTHIHQAQHQFSQNDLDRDGKANFWRADLAGLAAFGLIDPALANADRTPGAARPGPAAPLGGYWFKAIPYPDEIGGRVERSRYAYCAYPADPSWKQPTFVITESTWIQYRHELDGGVDVVPPEEVLRTWGRCNGG